MRSSPGTPILQAAVATSPAEAAAPPSSPRSPSSTAARPRTPITISKTDKQIPSARGRQEVASESIPWLPPARCTWSCPQLPLRALRQPPLLAGGVTPMLRSAHHCGDRGAPRRNSPSLVTAAAASAAGRTTTPPARGSSASALGPRRGGKEAEGAGANVVPGDATGGNGWSRAAAGGVTTHSATAATV